LRVRFGEPGTAIY
jgi:hypothetical protein